MKVRYLTSASVIIEHKNTKILCDPWLVDGEYYGSWCHYPKLDFKPDNAYGSTLLFPPLKVLLLDLLLFLLFLDLLDFLLFLPAFLDLLDLLTQEAES